jgi:ribosomal protein L11 methyltransferase
MYHRGLSPAKEKYNHDEISDETSAARTAEAGSARVRAMTEHESWSTVRVAMTKVALEPAAIAEATEQLEGLAALLAERDDVGGVETRDPTCVADGPEFVAVERPELIVYTTPDARDAIEVAARELVEMLGLDATIDVADHHGDDWRDAWKRHYRPLTFTSALAPEQRLLIRPSWIERTSEDPTRELVLDPGRAFGTGLHESTRLCLQALVELGASTLASESPRAVLDLGCGSGILGLAAARIWPTIRSLCLADYDIEAIETARENAERNDLLEQIEFLELDLAGGAPLPASLHGADLVLANIRPEILIPAAPAILAATAPGARVILSGILDPEGDAVLAAFVRASPPEATLPTEAVGFELLARPREADWCALVLRRVAV